MSGRRVELALAAVLAALLGGLCLAHTPLAFLRLGEVGYLYWQQVRDGQPIVFKISSVGTPDIEISPTHPDIDEFEAMELAFRAWEQVPGLDVTFDLQSTTTSTYGYDGQNVIFFKDLGNVGYGGVTLITYETATGKLLDVDVHLNDHNIRWLTSLNAPDGEPLPCPCQGYDPAAVYTNDVQGLSAHEIGHVLGLDHSAVGIRESAMTPTMYPRGIWNVPGDGTRPPNSRYRTPELDDVVGLQTLYPPASWPTETGSFEGSVRNRHDEPLFGAYVIARDLDTGEEVGAMSGVVAGPLDEEAYRLAGLPPGDYELRVEPIDGSAPGFVTPSMFGGITNHLVPQKIGTVVDLVTTYWPYGRNADESTTLTLAAGHTAEADFRPPAFVSRLPRLLYPPRAFEFEVKLNTEVTGPVSSAKLVYSVDGGEPVEKTLPTDGRAEKIPVPELPSGRLVDYHIEFEQPGSPVYRVGDGRMQVGLSGQPLILVSKTGLARISAIDSRTMFEVDETDLVLSFPLGQAFHRGRYGAYVASYGTDKISFVPFSAAALPPTSPTPFDTDGDRLLDELEPLFGTDPHDPDTDGDLGLDGAELSERYYRSATGGLIQPQFEVLGATLAQDGETPLGAPLLNIRVWNLTQARWESTAMSLTPTGRWRLSLPAGSTYRVSYFHALTGDFLGDTGTFGAPAGGRVSAGIKKIALAPPDPPPAETGTDPLDGVDGAVGVFLPHTDIPLPAGTDPYGVVLDPTQQFLYVTGYGSSKVIKIDTATHLVVASATLSAPQPKGIAVTPDGTRLYVASAGANRVSVLDAVTLATVRTISLSGPAHYVTLPGDGSTAIVTSGASGADVVFIDTTTDQVAATEASDLGGLVFLGGQTCNSMAVAGTFFSGAHALALADAESRQVSVVDLGPSVYTTSGVALHPYRNVGYAIHYSSPELLEFDLSTGAILRRTSFDFIDIRDIGLVIDAQDLTDPEGDGLISVCDNCPFSANTAQADGDLDGEGDACDLDACGEGPPAPGETLAFSKTGEGTGISWQAVQGVSEYHLYRGYSIGAGFLEGGGYTHQCLHGTIAGTKTNEPYDPPPFVLYYYLIAAKCPIGVQQSSLGTGSWGDERATLEGLTCPVFVPDWDMDGTPEFPQLTDNCPLDFDTSQANADRDSFGDVCDNCPAADNQGQEDNEHDGLGDVCDDDDDDDGILDDGDGSGQIGDRPCIGGQASNPADCDDNCRTIANPPADCDDDPATRAEQCDQDRDGLGDACDPDLDGDGLFRRDDNCPRVFNPEQEDSDGDGVGDACE